MRVAFHFPQQIEELPRVWIPLSDGTRLSARVWLPKGSRKSPVPAILEYLPYRKDDGTSPVDETHHRYFAGHGYAALRVDLRGTGDSEGIIKDEYAPQEQCDAEEVLAWIASQPWCDGKVGMYGYSWGGFNGLQVAARRPPQLKAVISLCSTDDRYRNDCHYMGGCLLASDMLKWSSVMFASNATPPDPEVVGPKWREMWLERMASTPPFIEKWLSHQRRDEYWKQGSVGENYSAIEAPVMLVGGWNDPYVSSIPRLLAGLTAPHRAIIGPWSHEFPEWGVPGPSIDFLHECVRWWDHWLKDKETGVMEEPLLRFWLMESEKPATSHAAWRGSWQSETAWPPKRRGAPLRYWLQHDGSLKLRRGNPKRLTLRGNQCTGADGAVWCPNGWAEDFPPDQREDNSHSLRFTTAVLKRPVAILGEPVLSLRVSSDKPLALVAARLCDIGPNGEATRVSWGLLNLSHRRSDEYPRPLDPRETYDIELRLNAIGYQFQPGHRIQVDLSPTYWPHAWPSPEAATLKLSVGDRCTLALPAWHRPRKSSGVKFGEAVIAMPKFIEVLRRSGRRRDKRHDGDSGFCSVTDDIDYGAMRMGNGTVWDERHRDAYRIKDNNPLTAACSSVRDIAISRGKWNINVHTESELTCDAGRFFVKNLLVATEDGKEVFRKTWKKEIARYFL